MTKPASPDRRHGFAWGVMVGAAAAMTAAAVIVLVADPTREARSASDQAREVIQDNYLHPVPGSVLDSASIDGMVRKLRGHYGDRFSHYFDPESLSRFEQSTSGEFSGVGLTVSQVPRGLRVASILPDTPAERSAIEEGDVITAVDGRSIAGVPSEVSTARIKGPPGTEVTLNVIPVAAGRPNEVTLRRASVRVPAVHGEIRHVDGRKVAYVRYATFSQGASDELRSTLEGLYERGAQGLVLDMRGNGGGLLNEAVSSASLFLDEGETVVTTKSRVMGDHTYEASGDSLERLPTVVLINQDTASAAEILTAALSDHGLADVVGTRSYGKGTFQEVIHLPAGGALDLTVGQFFAAGGESLLDTGIKPDVRASDDPITPPDEGLQRALRVLGQSLAQQP